MLMNANHGRQDAGLDVKVPQCIDNNREKGLFILDTFLPIVLFLKGWNKEKEA